MASLVLAETLGRLAHDLCGHTTTCHNLRSGIHLEEGSRASPSTEE